MSKVIFVQSGDIVNFEKVAAVYIDVEKNLNPDDTVTTEFSIKADAMNSTYTLGVYDTENDAETAMNHIKEWLKVEAFGVCDLNADGGD